MLTKVDTTLANMSWAAETNVIMWIRPRNCKFEFFHILISNMKRGCSQFSWSYIKARILRPFYKVSRIDTHILITSPQTVGFVKQQLRTLINQEA